MSESGKPAQSCRTTSFLLQSARADKMSGLPQNSRGGKSTLDRIEKTKYKKNCRKKPLKNKIPQNLSKDSKLEKRNQTKNSLDLLRNNILANFSKFWLQRAHRNSP